MVEHQIDTGVDGVELCTGSETVDQRSLSDEQWTVYNCLRDRKRPIDLATLTRELLEERRRTRQRKALSDGPTDEDAGWIEIRLHHVVLPSLDGLGVLSYDPGRREAAPPEGVSRF